AVVAVARRERRRHRQPRTMQTVGQLPLLERPRALLALPDVAIARDARDQPAAPVVAQHVVLARGSDEMGGAAAARRAIELAARPAAWPAVRRAAAHATRAALEPGGALRAGGREARLRPCAGPRAAVAVHQRAHPRAAPRARARQFFRLSRRTGHPRTAAAL